MQNDRTLSEELKFQFKFGGMHIKLIFVNTLFFLAIKLLGLIGRITDQDLLFETIQLRGFTLQTHLSELLIAPYGFITSIFSHFDFFHFLLNMVFLYLSGNIFRQFFSDRRMLHVYLVGGITGGIAEVIVQQFMHQYPAVIGASGSVMALFMAIAVYRPHYKVVFFGILPIKLFILALIFLGVDILHMLQVDGTAHFAHLGGAAIGFLSVKGLHSSSNLINWTESIHQRILSFFSGRKNRSPKMKAQKGGGRVVKTDEQYNMDAKVKQERIDKILDKISKSGYESLTKAEKDFLFSQSNK
jgi:membrane associated rhomboid family serine protease